MSENKICSIIGSAQTGKTSLIKAFQYSIKNWNTANQKMIIRIKTGKAADQLTELIDDDLYLDNITATEQEIIEFVRISREPISSIVTRSQSLSKATFDISFADDKGGVFATINNPHKSYKNEVTQARERISTSALILVILDPTEGINEKSPSLRILDYLINSEENQIPSTPRIAIVITKIDAVKNWGGTPPDHYIQYNLPHIAGRVNELRNRFGEANIKSFIISSFGFVEHDGYIVANTEEYDGKIIYRDRENWMPYKVCEPFFWLFEEYDKDFLREKLAQRPSWKKLLEPTEDLLKLYIPWGIIPE